MVQFSALIKESMEWTGTVLFRPFRIKKWLFLTMVALLAGQLSGTFNSSNNYSPARKQAQAAVQDAGQSSTVTSDAGAHRMIDDLRSFKQGFMHYSEKNRALPVVLWGIGIVGFLVILVLTWLSSRFSFVFLDDVVKNDASIRKPFRAYKKEGNSLFGFTVIFGIASLLFLGALFLLAFGTLLKSGVFNQSFQWPVVVQMLGIIWPYLLVFLVCVCIAMLIHLLLYDFVVPVMYKDAVGVCAGWRKILSIIGGRVRDVVVYILLKIVFYIISILGLMFVSFVALAGLVFQGLIGAIIAFGVYKFSPVVLHLPYKIAFFAVAIPVFIILAYCFVCLGLPIAVFFRTFSAQFVSRLIPGYSFLVLCGHCGSEKVDAAGYCAPCIAIQKKEVIAKPYRSPQLAAIMSFVIGGFGQIYNGQVAKGLLIFFTSWLIIPWVLGIRDAYTTALKINDGGIVAKKRFGCLVAMAVAVAVGALLIFVIAMAASFMSSASR